LRWRSPALAPTVPQVATGEAGCRDGASSWRKPRPEAMEPADEGEEMRRSGEEER